MKQNLLRIRWQLPVIVVLSFLSAWSYAVGAIKKGKASLQNIETIVVIYAENRSFDNLYGMFPGANGILKTANGESADFHNFRQIDRDGITPLKGTSKN